MKQALAIAAFSLAISSCTVVFNPPVEQGSTTVGTSSSVQKRETDNKPSNIAEAIRLCRKIQQSNEIPVACKASYLEGEPTMYIGFPNMQTGKEWISAFTEYVAGPYCYSANQANRNAFLVFVIQDLNIGKVYSCESGEASKWVSLGSAEDGKKPSNISEAISACKNLQKASNIPITCNTEYIQGKPGMFIGFPSIKVAEKWISAFSEYVAEPFCSSANRANRQAFLFFVVQDLQVGKLYSCESGDVSNWLDLSK